MLINECPECLSSAALVPKRLKLSACLQTFLYHVHPVTVVVIHQLPTVETWVQSWGSPCGIQYERMHQGRFSFGYIRFSLPIIISSVPYSHMSTGTCEWPQYKGLCHTLIHTLNCHSFIISIVFMHKYWFTDHCSLMKSVNAVVKLKVSPLRNSRNHLGINEVNFVFTVLFGAAVTGKIDNSCL